MNKGIVKTTRDKKSTCCCKHEKLTRTPAEQARFKERSRPRYPSLVPAIRYADRFPSDRRPCSPRDTSTRPCERDEDGATRTPAG